jgi:agmatine deiminase
VDSAWARDYGPLQVRTPDRGVIWLDAPYTESRPKDDVIPAKLAARLPARTESLGWAIDGGAIASNGEGLCVMTHEYAQGIDLAFGDDPTTIEVLDIVGCPHFVLVPALSQEETKHVDLFLQFIEPDVVVVGEFDRDEAPEDALRMDIAIDGLIRGANRGGLDLVIVRVPTPAPEGNIYRSYVNFFRTADLLLVPRYLEVPDLLERAAYDVLDEVMPGLDLVPIPSDDIVEYGGALHCTTLGLAISTAEWPTTALNEK